MKQILNILKQFTDKKNPKVELGYIYYYADKNWLVATDTIRLLILEPNENQLKIDVFIDINNKNLGTKPKIFYKNILCYEPIQIGNYPNIESVLNSVLKDADKKTITTKADLATVVTNVGSFLKNDTIIEYSKKYDVLKNVRANVYDISYKSNREPICINGLITDFSFKLIVMPYKED